MSPLARWKLVSILLLLVIAGQAVLQIRLAAAFNRASFILERIRIVAPPMQHFHFYDPDQREA